MMNVATKVITDVNMWLLSMSRGKIGTHFLGKPVLLLATVGRKIGKPRTTPLFSRISQVDPALSLTRG